MRNNLKATFIVATLVSLCGCDVEVYHQLDRYGNSDSGAYRISMTDELYLTYMLTSDYDNFIGQAREFSNPVVRSSGGTTFIEDLSGTASMEHIYDDYDCQDDPTSSRYVICEFTAAATELYQPGWSIAWTVQLEPDMRMVSSNHHRTRTENGRAQYIWYFDGDRVSAFDVRFRVRTPRA